MLCFIFKTQGQPADHVLDHGLGIGYYFNKDQINGQQCHLSHQSPLLMKQASLLRRQEPTGSTTCMHSYIWWWRKVRRYISNCSLSHQKNVSPSFGSTYKTSGGAAASLLSLRHKFLCQPRYQQRIIHKLHLKTDSSLPVFKQQE